MKFTPMGVVLVSIAFWIFAQNASGDTQKMYNLFLFTLLMSILLLNWSKVKPILFKQ